MQQELCQQTPLTLTFDKWAGFNERFEKNEKQWTDVEIQNPAIQEGKYENTGLMHWWE